MLSMQCSKNIRDEDNKKMSIAGYIYIYIYIYIYMVITEIPDLSIVHLMVI